MNWGFYFMEVWKNIKGYEGLYQVSNFGRVKSLERKVITSKRKYTVKEKMLSQSDRGHGYLRVCFSKKGIEKTMQVHQLVAMAFLNHTPKKTNKIVDHINNIKTDNRLKNLQIITVRENCTKDAKGHISKYVGVSKRKDRNKWIARIMINNKSKHLGYFDNEYDAHLAYQNALKEIENEQ